MTFDELLRLAENGDVESQYQLSRFYYEGDGVEKDEQRSLMWLTKAADAGLLDAMTTLAVLLRKGREPEKVKIANQLLFKAAEAGDLTATLTLSLHYSVGIGLAKDNVKACTLVIKACLLGAPLDNEIVKTQFATFTEEEILSAFDRLEWPKLWITFGPPTTGIMAEEFQQFQKVELEGATNTRWFKYELENIKSITETQTDKHGTVIDVLWNKELAIRSYRAAVTADEQLRYVTCQISFKDIIASNGLPVIQQPSADALTALASLLAYLDGREWVRVRVVW